MKTEIVYELDCSDDSLESISSGNLICITPTKYKNLKKNKSSSECQCAMLKNYADKSPELHKSLQICPSVLRGICRSVNAMSTTQNRPFSEQNPGTCDPIVCIRIPQGVQCSAVDINYQMQCPPPCPRSPPCRRPCIPTCYPPPRITSYPCPPPCPPSTSQQCISPCSPPPSPLPCTPYPPPCKPCPPPCTPYPPCPPLYPPPCRPCPPPCRPCPPPPCRPCPPPACRPCPPPNCRPYPPPCRPCLPPACGPCPPPSCRPNPPCRPYPPPCRPCPPPCPPPCRPCPPPCRPCPPPCRPCPPPCRPCPPPCRPCPPACPPICEPSPCSPCHSAPCRPCTPPPCRPCPLPCKPCPPPACRSGCEAPCFPPCKPPSCKIFPSCTKCQSKCKPFPLCYRKSKSCDNNCEWPPCGRSICCSTSCNTQPMCPSRCDSQECSPFQDKRPQRAPPEKDIQCCCQPPNLLPHSDSTQPIPSCLKNASVLISPSYSNIESKSQLSSLPFTHNQNSSPLNSINSLPVPSKFSNIHTVLHPGAAMSTINCPECGHSLQLLSENTSQLPPAKYCPNKCEPKASCPESCKLAFATPSLRSSSSPSDPMPTSDLKCTSKICKFPCAPKLPCETPLCPSITPGCQPCSTPGEPNSSLVENTSETTVSYSSKAHVEDAASQVSNESSETNMTGKSVPPSPTGSYSSPLDRCPSCDSLDYPCKQLNPKEGPVEQSASDISFTCPAKKSSCPAKQAPCPGMNNKPCPAVTPRPCPNRKPPPCEDDPGQKNSKSQSKKTECPGKKNCPSKNLPPCPGRKPPTYNSNGNGKISPEIASICLPVTIISSSPHQEDRNSNKKSGSSSMSYREEISSHEEVPSLSSNSQPTPSPNGDAPFLGTGSKQLQVQLHLCTTQNPMKMSEQNSVYDRMQCCCSIETCKCNQTSTHEEKNVQCPAFKQCSCQTEPQEDATVQCSRKEEAGVSCNCDEDAMCQCQKTESSSSSSSSKSSSESFMSCVCCKKEKILKKLINKQPLCNPCQKVHQKCFYPYAYSNPLHSCMCYSLVDQGTLCQLKTTLTELERLDIYQQYCEILKNCKCCKKCGCKCKLPKKFKNGCAYFLKLEDACPNTRCEHEGEGCGCDEYNEDEEEQEVNYLPEVTVKVPNCRGPCAQNKKNNMKNETKNQMSCPSIQTYLCTMKPEFIEKAERRRKILRHATLEREEDMEKRKLRFIDRVNYHKQKLRNQVSSETNVYGPYGGVAKTYCTFDIELDDAPRRIGPRVFRSFKEMKDLTRRKYMHLSEVRSKKDIHREKRLREANRILANTFTKKLQRSTLRGTVDIPPNVRVVSY